MSNSSGDGLATGPSIQHKKGRGPSAGRVNNILRSIGQKKAAPKDALVHEICVINQHSYLKELKQLSNVHTDIYEGMRRHTLELNGVLSNSINSAYQYRSRVVSLTNDTETVMNQMDIVSTRYNRTLHAHAMRYKNTRVKMERKWKLRSDCDAFARDIDKLTTKGDVEKLRKVTEKQQRAQAEYNQVCEELNTLMPEVYLSGIQSSCDYWIDMYETEAKWHEQLALLSKNMVDQLKALSLEAQTNNLPAPNKDVFAASRPKNRHIPKPHINGKHRKNSRKKKDVDNSHLSATLPTMSYTDTQAASSTMSVVKPTVAANTAPQLKTAPPMTQLNSISSSSQSSTSSPVVPNKQLPVVQEAARPQQPRVQSPVPSSSSDSDSTEVVPANKVSNSSNNHLKGLAVATADAGDSDSSSASTSTTASITSAFDATARYPYPANSNDEITLQPNDLLRILPWKSPDQKETGWYYGENLTTGKKGLFPSNYIYKTKK